PALNHVDAPQESEHPQGAEGEGAVEFHPPRLEGMRPDAELAPPLQEVVEHEPEAPREPEAAPHHVDENASARRQPGSKHTGHGRPLRVVNLGPAVKVGAPDISGRVAVTEPSCQASTI